MKKYKSLIVIPVVIIIISLFIIGRNLVIRRDSVDNIGEAVPSGVSSLPKTEEEENEELGAITDKIDINKAAKSELMLLDGIGDVLADRIIEKREEIGGFVAVEQICEVEGIGEKIYEGIKDYIIIR